MAHLTRIRIEIDTLFLDTLDPGTALHIFVKNRRGAKLRSDSAFTSLKTTTFAEDKIAYDEHEKYNQAGNPDFPTFLGRKENANQGSGMDSPRSFDLDLSPWRQIQKEEVVMPIVSIHIAPDGRDRWYFRYHITFSFSDETSFSSDSDVAGIILDQDNKDYTGICTENPFISLPAPPTPNTNSVLTRLVLEFFTHNDNKDPDTKVNVRVVNRQSVSGPTQDISIASDISGDQEFDDPSYYSLDLPLASNNILLRDMVLPEVIIDIEPNGDDRWIFDYRITFYFTDPSTTPGVFREPFSSIMRGVILDEHSPKHIGAYSGRSFPTFVTPPAPLSNFLIDHYTKPKVIPLTSLKRRLDEFFNKRQGADESPNPPFMKVRFDNTGRFTGALPESYVDVQSIEADPPPPRSVMPAVYRMGVKYNSSITSFGQIAQAWYLFGLADLYLNNINSKSLTVNVNASSPTPIEVILEFDTSSPEEVVGGSSISLTGTDFDKLSITLRLTLRFDAVNGRVDLMKWIDEIKGLTFTYTQPDPDAPGYYVVNGSFLGEPINDTTSAPDDFRYSLMRKVLYIDARVNKASDDRILSIATAKLFNGLDMPDKITHVSPRDSLNATINSWLLGGEIQSGNTSPMAFPNPCILTDASVDDRGNLVMQYIGPSYSFLYQKPSDWPTTDKPNPKYDFSPGTLSNIDHIIVLTMENRSFDHMLGYLSLPESMGGRDRKDIDGLKPDQSNTLNGNQCFIFPFKPGETIFTPDPPHDTEPVSLAINGGKMDGFAQSYADLRGNELGQNIMGYHTAATIPVYDSLARDFAISDRWFASHPGPTFPNRFYQLTGRPNIDAWGFWEYTDSKPLHPVFTDTIFDYLTDHNVTWKYFEHSYCFLRFFEKYTFDDTNIISFDDPVSGFEELARSGDLPSVSFIDPKFIEYPPDSNCDGPPADVKLGQDLVWRVVTAVVTSPKWSKTLLIITYDEHGGFFDHVAPPPCPKVSPELVDTYGVRVPTFIITPWVKGGSVFGSNTRLTTEWGGTHGTAGTASPHTLDSSGSHSVTGIGSPGPVTAGAPHIHSQATVSTLQTLHFDHTSILKTIARRFMSTSPPYMGPRFAAAHDLSEVLTNEMRPSQFRPFIGYVLSYSELNLSVQDASNTSGTPLIQSVPFNSADQAFRFEDADDGFFFIRTLAGNMYLTVDVPSGTDTGPGTNLRVKQDIKYPVGSATPRNRDFQRWKFTSGGVDVLHQNDFTVTCAAFPNKVLQPLGNSTAAGTAVVIGDPSQSHLPNQIKNPWHVSTPLLADRPSVPH